MLKQDISRDRLGTLLGVVISIVALTWSLLSPAGALGGAARIVMDGDFSDWDGLDPVAADPTGDTNPAFIDFGRLWVSNDERYLFISIELDQEINLQSNNEIVLYLDTDDDPATGIAAHGIGAELVWTFGRRRGTFTYPSGSSAVEHAHVGIIAAPTVTSERFEIAFDRSARPASSLPLFGGRTLRMVFEDASGTDLVPDGEGGVAYTFDDTHLDPLPSLSLARHDETHLRILTYNVLFDGFFDSGKRPHFNRLLAALNPDIIGFEEIYDHSAGETQSRVEAILPSGGQGGWYSAKEGPDIIAVSRYPITESFTVSGNGAFLIDLRPTYDKDLLLIVAHTPCCSYESDRQREIDAFMAFIRDAKAPGGPIDLLPETPIVIVGDMNLVGYRQQLETMLTGDIVNVSTYGPPFSPDWDGSDLEDAMPPHTDLPMTFTWTDEWSSYWPGRLDFIVYTGSVLETGNSFVAYTPSMKEDTLAAYGLEAQDAVSASDHLPVVADFALPASVAQLGIHCLDVGYGDCTLIVSPAGGTLLIGAGPDGRGDQVVVPYLEDLGISALDYICACNYSPEHLGGIDEVVGHLGIDSIRVAVLDRGYSAVGDAYQDYLTSVSAKRAALAKGQSIDLGGGVTVTCIGVNGNGLLQPPFDQRYDEADLSIALVVKYLGFDFFVAGDLPGTDEAGHVDVESSLAYEVGDIDVYRVSNHGGISSSSRNLVSALLPEVAVISVGAEGPGGYPAQEVIDRLVGYGAYIYQTQNGTDGQIPDGHGEIVGGNIVIRVGARSFTVNGTDTYEIEDDAIAISLLNQDDSNGEPLLLGRPVTLRGVVTVGSGVFSTSKNDIFIQDATGGVNVFQQSSIDPAVETGDKVQVEGFVDSFAGLTRITTPTIRTKASDISLPEPVPIATGNVATGIAAYEGSLVRLEKVHITGGGWPPVGSDGTLTVDDGSGECEVFIDEDTDLAGSSDIPDTFNLVGVLGQYDPTFPFLSGHRVMPRSREDIEPIHGDGGPGGSSLVVRITPNPARRSMVIVFTGPAAAYSKRISLYDIQGRKVARTRAAAGTASFNWTPHDGSGATLTSGIYFMVVEAAGREETRKLVITH